METKWIKLNRDSFSENELIEAANILKEGGLVAFPTETVYGLGANALDKTAAGRIYQAKGRPSDNPLIVHITELASLDFLAREVPKTARKLGEAFWPGPLTMILKKSAVVPKETTGGLDTVAIRLPSDPIARSLIRLSGLFLAAPSANASGRPSTTMAEHVWEDLNGRIEMLLDGGPVTIGLESTIVDLTGEIPLILRPGFITKEQIETIIGPVAYDKAVIATKPLEDLVAKAPGMKYRHYAPKGELTIYDGPRDVVVKAMNEQIREAMAKNKIVGVLATDESASLYEGGTVFSIGSRKDEETIAANLYRILRDFDTMGAELIFSESFEDNPLSKAIMNRLRKASGYRIVSLWDEIS